MRPGADARLRGQAKKVCGCMRAAWARRASARRLLRQAAAHDDHRARLAVVRRMYEMRFDDPLPKDMTLREIRGAEGARSRDAYGQWSRQTGVPWSGREYRRDEWSGASPINRALSAANSCLYGVCHAAIVSVGYSPGLGFVHTGKALSFVYDVADLNKTETSVPAAFKAAASGAIDVERAARHELRNEFHTTRLVGRVVDDLAELFAVSELDEEATGAMAGDLAAPGGLWDIGDVVTGGHNYADREVGDGTDRDRR